VRDVHVTKVHVDRYVHVDHAVVVKNHDFYRANNYRDFRVRDVDRKTIVTRYQPSPVIDQKIVPAKGRDRYSFSPSKPEKRRESVSREGGPDRPIPTKEERLKSRATGPSGQKDEKRESVGTRSTPSRIERKGPIQGDQPGKPQVQQGRAGESTRPDAAKREMPSSVQRPVDVQGGSGKTGSRSGAGELQTPSKGEIQRPSVGPGGDRVKGGGAERGIPRQGRSDRELKESRQEPSPGNTPRREISSPEKLEKQIRTAPRDDTLGRPSGALNHGRQSEPDKKEQQQRGGRGRE
jgi:hypothetical protein